MDLNFSLNKRITKTEKNVDVVACPETKLNPFGEYEKVLIKWLISGLLLGRNLSTEFLIRFTNWSEKVTKIIKDSSTKPPRFHPKNLKIRMITKRNNGAQLNCLVIANQNGSHCLLPKLFKNINNSWSFCIIESNKLLAYF